MDLSTYRKNAETFAKLLTFAAVALLYLSAVSLAEDVSSCQEINRSGYYSLSTDLTDTKTCVVISTSDVVFEGNGHAITGVVKSGSYGIYVYNQTSTLTNVTIRNVVVKSWYAGVFYRSVERGVLANINASLNSYGILLKSSNRIRVSDSVVNSNSLHGISLENSSYSTITNSILEDNGNGITLWKFSTHNAIRNNTARSNGIGIYLGSYGVYPSPYNDHNLIENNAVISNSQGIEIAASGSNVVSNNNVSFNAGDGITITYVFDPSCYCYRASTRNIVENNTIEHNGGRGIYVESSNYNVISDNSVSYNRYYSAPGVSLYSSSHNEVANNVINNNAADAGISLAAGSNYNSIHENTARFNKFGITIDSSKNNVIAGNSLSENSYAGIYLRTGGADNNTFASNIVAENLYGIYHWGGNANNNTFYNNYFNNTNNIHPNLITYALENFWNASKSSGTNIVGGGYIGGNYWAKADDTGFSQMCDDFDADGICDSPYYLNTENADYFPLSGVGRDIIPPAITFLPPTPGNGSRVSTEKVTVRIESSEDLRNATVEWNGIVESMSGSGKSWEITFDVSKGEYWFRVRGEDFAGNRNSTKIVTFDVVGPKIDSCAVIDAAGYYYLTRDLQSSAECIRIVSSNVTIDGRFHRILGSSASARLFGISVGDSGKALSNVTLKNIIVVNSATGILLRDTSDSKIVNVRAASNQYGITLIRSENIEIANSILRLNKNVGINVLNSSNVTIEGNRIEYCSEGISLLRSSLITITDNGIRNSSNGIYLRGSSNSELKGNLILSSSESGIRIENSRNATAITNTISDQRFGVRIVNSFGMIIGENEINSSRSYGISLELSGGSNISGNAITNSGTGVRIYRSDYNNLTDNLVNSSYRAISILESRNSTILDNALEGSSYGIFLFSSTYTKMSGNTIGWNNVSGVFLSSSRGSRVIENFIVHNRVGIETAGSGEGSVVNNTIELNGIGVKIAEGTYEMLKNKIKLNNFTGIMLQSSGNTIKDNEVISNGRIGIDVYSSGNDVTGNVIAFNGKYGLVIRVPYDVTGIKIYNNYFNNTNNTKVRLFSSSVWNAAKTPGRNIIGGHYLAGNYWAKPSGEGFSQLCEDVNADGICDSAYEIDFWNIDHIPITLNAFDPVPLSVNFTEKTLSNGSVSPQNHVFVEIVSSKRLSKAILQWNGENETMTPDGSRKTWSFNVTELSEGYYSFRVLAMDFGGRWKATETRTIEVDFSSVRFESCIAITQPGKYVLAKNIRSSETACIVILSDGVELIGNGHTVEGRNLLYSNGLLISDRGSAGNVVVRHVKFSKWYAGIHLSNTTNVNLEEVASSSNRYGIRIMDSSSIALINSVFNNNVYDGVNIYSSSHITMLNVSASNNGDSGIKLHSSEANYVKRSATLSNVRSGISLLNSNSNVIEEVRVAENNVGISMTSNSERNTVKNSTITSNSRGLYFQAANGNLIYNNYLNNSENHYQLYSVNTFNVRETPGKNIAGGNSVGGNYWSGFSETCGDLNGDDICDRAYRLDGRNVDDLPLAKPVTDSDGDGIPDSQEAGDFNNDGVPDYLQPDVAAAKTSGSIVVFSSQDNRFSEVKREDLSQLQPPPVSLPYGVYSFYISVTPGSSVTVTVYVYDSDGNAVVLPSNAQYWKYTDDGKGNPSNQPGWYSLPSIVEGNAITFTLTDGGVGDGDGDANGIITDPGGVGIRTSVPEFSSFALVIAVLSSLAVVFRRR